MQFETCSTPTDVTFFISLPVFVLAARTGKEEQLCALVLLRTVVIVRHL